MRRRDLGRVVGVVVVDGDAGRGATRAARTAGARRGSPAIAAAAPARIGARQRARGQRAGRVDRVVGARHRQRRPRSRASAKRDPSRSRQRRPGRRRRARRGGHSASSAGRSHTTAAERRAAHELAQRLARGRAASCTSCDGRARRWSAPRSRAQLRAASDPTRRPRSRSTRRCPSRRWRRCRGARRRRRRPGRARSARRTCTTIAAVVVLPCVPVTAMQRRSAAICASSSARCSSRPAAARRSGLSGGDRGREHDLGAGRDVLGGVADHRLDPGRAQARRVGGLGAGPSRSRSAPSACAMSASPLIPAPPMPTKCSLRADQSSPAALRRAVPSLLALEHDYRDLARSVLRWYSS